MSSGPSPDQRVGAIIGAAEDIAEQIRLDAERRLDDRLAEAQRAADNRIRAAESEAAEILSDAREDGARLREAAGSDAKAIVEGATSEARDIVARAQSEADRIRMKADEHRENATSDALAVISRAQENADSVLAAATAEAAKLTTAATERSRELIKGARHAAGVVDADGQSIVRDLRELGDSMRSNAARLLRDVQTIHTAMLDQIDRVDPEGTASEAVRRPAAGPVARSQRSGGRRRGGAKGEDRLDVPEFIPRG
jgi:cell division septum initiation protein DivIVA